MSFEHGLETTWLNLLSALLELLSEWHFYSFRKHLLNTKNGAQYQENISKAWACVLGVHPLLERQGTQSGQSCGVQEHSQGESMGTYTWRFCEGSRLGACSWGGGHPGKETPSSRMETLWSLGIEGMARSLQTYSDGREVELEGRSTEKLL
jgi:hypothetical protein